MLTRELLPVVGSLLLLMTSAACVREAEPTVLFITGNTFGSTYRVKVLERGLSSSKIEALHHEIIYVLRELALQMNAQDPESQIARYNQLAVGEKIKIGEEFAELLTLYQKSKDSAPAFVSPSAGKLASLWAGATQSPPQPEQIAALLNETYAPWALTQNESILRKLTPAKMDIEHLIRAFLTDRVASTLRKLEFKDFLIEIGSEAYGEGLNLESQPWTTGIKIADHEDTLVLKLQNRASGYAAAPNSKHAPGTPLNPLYVDPASGHPIHNDLAAVIVVADNALRAKSAAITALMMGPEKAKVWISTQKDLDTLLVLRPKEGGPVRMLANLGFRKLRGDPAKNTSLTLPASI